MKQVIYCSILAILLLVYYPFKTELIWIPARDFEIVFNELFVSKDAINDFQLELDFVQQSTQTIDSTRIQKPLRILELLKESGLFAKPFKTNKPYFKIKLSVKSHTFSSELTYQQFINNMPIQLVINLLLMEGSYTHLPNIAPKI